MMAMANHSRVDGRAVHTISRDRRRVRQSRRAAGDGRRVRRRRVSVRASGNSACLGAALRAWHADARSRGREIPWTTIVRDLAEPIAGIARHARCPSARARCTRTCASAVRRVRARRAGATRTAEQKIDDQLVETLVGQPPWPPARWRSNVAPCEQRSPRRASTRAGGAVVGRSPRGSRRAAPESRDPAANCRALSFEDQVRAHAAAREVPDAVGVLGAVRVRVEMPRAVVAGLFEQLDDEEQRLDRLGSEPQILIEAPEFLVVQIDVEQLAGLERLRDDVVGS